MGWEICTYLVTQVPVCRCEGSELQCAGRGVQSTGGVSHPAGGGWQ